MSKARGKIARLHLQHKKSRQVSSGENLRRFLWNPPTPDFSFGTFHQKLLLQNHPVRWVMTGQFILG